MSITRSQIARQLLAEGGAPRKGFYVGGSPADSQNNPSPSSSFDDGFDSGEEFGRDTYAEQLADLQRTENTFPNIGDVSGDDLRNVSIKPDGRSDAPSILDFTPLSLIKRADERFLKPMRDRTNLKLRTDFLRRQGLIGPGEEDFRPEYEDDFLISPAGLEMLRGMGYKTVGDMRDESLGGDNEPMIRRLRAPITEAAKKEEPKNEFNELLKFYGARFKDGGEVREGYFGGGLTDVFKKGVGAVKKIVKSPIGKAALAFGAYKLAGSPKIFGKDSFISKLTKDKALQGILAASLASGLYAKQEEDDDEKLPTAAQSDPEFQNLLAFYGGPRRFAEEGGDIEDAPKKKPSGIMMASNIENDEILESLFEKYLEMGLSPKDAADKARQEFDKMSKAKEPDRMTAQEGGLMNLGGNEMDLRGGGFVPLGAKEKADDVPARLSKNEFVFTADAVRAAGGGSVDRGADIMYKTMKNLENKVA